MSGQGRHVVSIYIHGAALVSYFVSAIRGSAKLPHSRRHEMLRLRSVLPAWIQYTWRGGGGRGDVALVSDSKAIGRRSPDRVKRL